MDNCNCSSTHNIFRSFANDKGFDYFNIGINNEGGSNFEEVLKGEKKYMLDYLTNVTIDFEKGGGTIFGYCYFFEKHDTSAKIHTENSTGLYEEVASKYIFNISFWDCLRDKFNCCKFEFIIKRLTPCFQYTSNSFSGVMIEYEIKYVGK